MRNCLLIMVFQVETLAPSSFILAKLSDESVLSSGGALRSGVNALLTAGTAKNAPVPIKSSGNAAIVFSLIFWIFFFKMRRRELSHKMYQPPKDPFEVEDSMNSMAPVPLEQHEKTRMLEIANSMIASGRLNRAEIKAMKMWKVSIVAKGFKGVAQQEFQRDFWRWARRACSRSPAWLMGPR